MTAPIAIREVIFGSPEYALTKAFREKHLRAPLGLALSDNDLTGEENQYHFAAFSNADIVGTVIMKPLSQTNIALRQMAVDPSIQKGGIGKNLVAAAEASALAHGFKRIQMTARKSAQGFYEHLGYKTDGDEFMDVIPVPSIKMVKDIS